MRTCKGTAARGYKRKTADMEDESSSSGRGFPPVMDSSAHDNAPSPPDSPSRSPSPAPSDSILISSPSSERYVPIRGISPDPSWGPNPLAAWKPTSQFRRHSVPAFPLPISQRIHISQSPLLRSFASPATTPSPSLVSAKASATASSSEGAVSMSTPASEGLNTQNQNRNIFRDAMDWSAGARPHPQQQQQYSFGNATQLAAVADSVRFHSHYPSVQPAGASSNEQHQSYYSTSPDSWFSPDKIGASASAGPSTKPISVAVVLPLSAESEYEGAFLYANMLGHQQRRRYPPPQLQPQPQLPPQSSSMWPNSSSHQMPSSSGIAVGDQAGDASMNAPGPLQRQGQGQAQGQGQRARDASDESIWNDFVDFG